MRHPEIATALEQQLAAFRAKFGRDPGPDDPVFFDPDADTPRAWDEKAFTGHITEAARKAGIPEVWIYAYQKTGMMVTEVNLSQWSRADMLEWNAAIAEFETMHK